LNYYNYFTEIEETFVRRRGKHLLLSPLDWALMESWQERGVPLHVALRAIESVFDGFDRAPRPRTIKGLLYCREEIEAQFQEWQAAQAGKADSAQTNGDETISADIIRQHIDRMIAFLRGNHSSGLSEGFERAALRLEELRENLSADLELVDGSLSDIEALLDEALLERSEPSTLRSIEKETKAQLRPYKESMEPDVYKKTFRLMMLKRLREETGTPRLSLFYL
jgi:hypothetical protein